MATPDIVHAELEGAFHAHRPDYSDMCPICGPRVLRARNVGKLHRALVEFGYSTLTREEVADAYDAAMRGDDPGADIIRMMVARQIREAGLIDGGGE